MALFNLPHLGKPLRIARKVRPRQLKPKEIPRAVTPVKDELGLGLNAITVLQKRYLLRNGQGRVVETPKQLFRRVAKAIAEVDYNYGSSASQVKVLEEEFHNLMTRREFMPNTPTLMNAGTPLGQLSACFVLEVDDSLPSIFKALGDSALIEQSGGGVGYSFSRLRPKGDYVKSTQGVASGPVTFMEVFDTKTNVIKQGGKRRGALMGVLRVDHPDIVEFITAKVKEGYLSNFNVSVAVTEKFMQAVMKNKEYELINPRNKQVVRKIRAREVWDLIISYAWKTGDPGLIFIDEVNKRNPTKHIGEIEATNPCITSDAWVMTDEGPKQVKELVDKKFIAWVNGQKFVSEKGFFSTGTKEIYRLRTNEGFEVKLTSDHPVLTIKRLSRYKKETVWKKVSELKEDDQIVLNDHGKADNWGVDNVYGEQEGYITGLLIGDGWISKDGVHLGSWGDSDGPASVRKLAYEAAIRLPHRSDFSGWAEPANLGKYTMSMASFSDITEPLGLRYGTKTITEEIERSSSYFYTGLLRGLFDTDGSVQGSQAKGVSVRLAQSNLPLLKAVQRMLLRLGIFSVIYEKRRPAGTRLLPDGKGGHKEYPIKEQHELVISTENLLPYYKRIGFGDAEKMQKLESLIKNYRRKLNRERFVATIKDIVPEGKEEVFDTKVENIHAFDGNGFVLHNCGEVPLHPNEACNLGSINLGRMLNYNDTDISWEKLRSTVRKCAHFLDNIIDVSKFPTPEITHMVKANRRIGLGVMGFADLLCLLKIPYNSDKAIELGEKIMKFINDEAHKMSYELGKKRGSFPNFKGSLWDEQGYRYMRNATSTTIAPTGTISIIAGCSSGIEPLFAVTFMRNVLEGTHLLEVNPIFEQVAREEGFYSEKLMRRIAKSGAIAKFKEIPSEVRKTFVTALEIPPEFHVKMQAAFQRHCDNAVSKTINFPHDAKVSDVKKAYELAYKLKCKGITIYRYGSKSEQVLYIGKIAEKGEPFVVAKPETAGWCASPLCPNP